MVTFETAKKKLKAAGYTIFMWNSNVKIARFKAGGVEISSINATKMSHHDKWTVLRWERRDTPYVSMDSGIIDKKQVPDFMLRFATLG